jgi:hypothetical protein
MPSEPSTMTAEYDDIFDSLFHNAAWAAFLDQAEAERGWPSREGTRRLAFQYYEEALAAKNRAKTEAGEGVAA